MYVIHKLYESSIDSSPIQQFMKYAGETNRVPVDIAPAGDIDLEPADHKYAGETNHVPVDRVLAG